MHVDEDEDEDEKEAAEAVHKGNLRMHGCRVVLIFITIKANWGSICRKTISIVKFTAPNIPVPFSVLAWLLMLGVRVLHFDSRSGLLGE